MKEKELRAVAKCAICGKSIGHTGVPLFWRVRMQRWGLLSSAIRRQSALEQFLDGHVTVAQVMGADEDMAKKMLSVEITVCETCAAEEQLPVMVLAAHGAKQPDEAQP